MPPDAIAGSSSIKVSSDQASTGSAEKTLASPPAPSSSDLGSSARLEVLARVWPLSRQRVPRLLDRNGSELLQPAPRASRRFDGLEGNRYHEQEPSPRARILAPGQPKLRFATCCGLGFVIVRYMN